MNNSSEDIKNLFFSKNNLDFTYEQVKRKVNQNVDYDITRNNNFKNNYNKMSLLVYNNTEVGDRNLAEKKSTVTFPFFRRHNGRNDEIAIAQPISTSSKSPTNGLANRVRPAIDVAFTATRMTSVKPPKKAA